MRKDRAVRVFDQDGEVIAEFYAVRRHDNILVVDGKALGVMRMDMFLRPEELLRSARIFFSWPVISYILLAPYFALRVFARRFLPVSKRAV